MADLGIQNAFLDGIEEIFSIMFTDRIHMSYLDLEKTVTNVYDEAEEKIYHEPIQLVGKINLSYSKSEDPMMTEDVKALVTIPTKQLLTKSIPHITKEDLEKLKKAKFSYDGHDFLVSEINPKTLVADIWQLYDFVCYKDR